jgi:hypothetical protein
MTRAVVAAWMVLAFGGAGLSHGQEIPAHTAFRLEAVGVVGVSYHAPRGSWTVVSVGGGPRTVYVDTFGQMNEHRLITWDPSAPIEQEVRGGQLYVRQRGRTYRFAPQGVYQTQLVVADVTRPYDGLIFRWWWTGPEWVQTTSWIPVTQWVEVISSPVPVNMSPTSSSDDRRKRTERPHTT